MKRNLLLDCKMWTEIKQKINSKEKLTFYYLENL